MSTKQRPVPVEKLTIVTLAVEDQQAALDWYEEHLGFDQRADAPFEMDGKEGRWLTMAPPGNEEIEIALVEPDPDLYEGAMLERIQEMHGTDPMWTFTTEDIDAAIADLDDRGVDIDAETMDTPWGRFAMFRDLDGNALQLHESVEMSD